MRLRILSVLLLLAFSPVGAASDLYAVVNRLRAGDDHCAIAVALAPLKRQGALERVARDLSQGRELKQSLNAVGYRATRFHALSIRGEGIDVRAQEMLTAPRYCQQLQDAAMTEVGIYVDARDLWIVMAAPFAASLGISEEAAGQRVLDLVNRARAAPRYCGNRAFSAVRPVRWNDTLAEVSRLHAEEMARYSYLSHSGRDGSDPAQRAERAGYRYRAIGENIAGGGQMKPEDAVAGWLKSPPHCANLMDPAFTEMGVAYAVDPKSELGVYWSQSFGTPR